MEVRFEKLTHQAPSIINIFTMSLVQELKLDNNCDISKNIVNLVK